MSSWRKRVQSGASYEASDAPADSEGDVNPFYFEQMDASELGAPPAEVMERLSLDQGTYDGMMQEVEAMQGALNRKGHAEGTKPLNIRVGSLEGRNIDIDPPRTGRKAPRKADRYATKRVFGGYDSGELG